MSPTVAATYSYDAQGQRTESVVSAGTETTTSTFVYAGLALLRLSASQSGGTENASWQITYLYDEYGRPYAGIYRDPAASTTPVVFGLLTTDRGDVVALLDAAGTPFAAYRYDAWGNPQGSGNLDTGIWAQTTTLITAALATDIALRQPLRYAGYYYDSESGLYYLSARTYDPQTGQFLAKDPLKTSEETSYQYCGGNPVGYTDPSGTLAADYTRRYSTGEYQEGYRWNRRTSQSDVEERTPGVSFEWLDTTITQAANGDLEAARALLILLGVYESEMDFFEYNKQLLEVIQLCRSVLYEENGPDPGAEPVVMCSTDPGGGSGRGIGVRAQDLNTSNPWSLLITYMRTNAGYAKRMLAGMDQKYMINWLWIRIKDHGLWDWKSMPNKKRDYGGTTLEQFGNMCLGYYGSILGLSLNAVKLASYLAALAEGKSLSDELYNDQAWIEKGYNAAKQWQCIDNGTFYYVVY